MKVKYKKYGEAFLLVFIFLGFFSMLLTLLGYFNITSSKITEYLILFLTMVSLFIGGFFLGKKCEQKGWLEGIKIGSMVIFLFFLISYLGFDQGLNVKVCIYYLILLVSSILGSMIGINKKEEN